MDAAIRTEGLTRSYGETKALDGLDLEAPAGRVFALLGPNGAGKTTAVRVLTTLLRPDAGRAFVGGIDVQQDPESVRRMIGLTGQYAALDDWLTGLENLQMIGQLIGLTSAEAIARANELLERFGLSDAADRPSSTYSGGMKRRLDLAASLVGRPGIVFLDEPTTGLDPRSRLALWDIVRELIAEGTTLLLTTQYLEEADALADRVAVIDHGRVIAEGTSDELKEKVGGRQLQLQVSLAEDLDRAVRSVRRATGSEPSVVTETRRISATAVDPAALGKVVRSLERAEIGVAELIMSRPSLDDVFLTLTGRPAETEADATAGGATDVTVGTQPEQEVAR